MKTLMPTTICRFVLLFLLLGLAVDASVQAAMPPQDPKPSSKSKDKTDKEPKPFVVKVSDDNIHFTVTGSWKKAPLRNSVIEYEIKVPRTGSDEQDGRLTIMGAGGSVDANVVRWEMQFSQPDGSATKAKTKKKTIAGQTVHFVDIQGTFMDAPGGPFSGKPKVERKDYRMLAAIIETENDGQYFVKLYGPKATIDKNEKHFKAMIESVQVVD